MKLPIPPLSPVEGERCLNTNYLEDINELDKCIGTEYFEPPMKAT